MRLICRPFITSPPLHSISTRRSPWRHNDAAQIPILLVVAFLSPTYKAPTTSPPHIHHFIPSLALLFCPALLICQVTSVISRYLLSSMSSLPATPLQEDDMRILAELSIHVAGVGLVIDCSKCGGAVPLTICQSDRSGNKGKPMARVCGAACSTQCEPS